MASVKVIVDVFQLAGYWAAGRHWPQGQTTAVLEDEPALSVDQKLAQLRHAMGGELLQPTGPGVEVIHRRSPPLLSLTIVPDGAEFLPQSETTNESTEEAASLPLSATTTTTTEEA